MGRTDMIKPYYEEDGIVIFHADCREILPHLTKAPAKLSDNLEVLQEQENQLKEYRKFVKKIELRKKKDMGGSLNEL